MLILNVSYPNEEIFKVSLSSLFVIMKLKLPSSVVDVPIYFPVIPTAAYGISKFFPSETFPEMINFCCENNE